MTPAIQSVLEHGEYLAQAAENMLTALNELHAAQEAFADTNHESEQAGLDAIADLEHAHESVNDHWRAVVSSIGDFRKRAARCQAGEGN